LRGTSKSFSTNRDIDTAALATPRAKTSGHTRSIAGFYHPGGLICTSGPVASGYNAAARSADEPLPCALPMGTAPRIGVKPAPVSPAALAWSGVFQVSQAPSCGSNTATPLSKTFPGCPGDIHPGWGRDLPGGLSLRHHRAHPVGMMPRPLHAQSILRLDPKFSIETYLCTWRMTLSGPHRSRSDAHSQPLR
jgi:hypothetical protein